MKLGMLIRAYRHKTDLTLMELAAEIGVGVSTLSRVETGDGMDGETLGKVLVWMMKPLKV